MKIKFIILVVVLLCGAVFLMVGRKGDEPRQSGAPESFLGSPPEASKPYNLLDYTKPPSKQ